MSYQREAWIRVLREAQVLPGMIPSVAIEVPEAVLLRAFRVLYPRLLREKAWAEILRELPLLLIEVLEVNDTRQQMMLIGDTRAFSAFVRARCTPLKETLSQVEVEGLWGLSLEASTARYQRWIYLLLSTVVDSFQLARYQEVGSLLKALDEVEAFSRLLPVQQEKERLQPSMLGYFKEWILRGLYRLQALIHTSTTLSDTHYLQTADRVWALLSRFGVMNDPAFERVRVNIHDCYDAIRASYARASYFFETGVARGLMNRVTGWIQKATWKGQVSSSIRALKQDLDALYAWSVNEGKAVLLEEGGKGALYARAHRLMTTRLARLDEAAFALRQRYEQEWRGTRDYVQRLGWMDTTFMALEERIQETKAKWCRTIASHYPEDMFFKQANEYFELLESEAARRFEPVDWVYQTGYAWETTEGKFAFEMEARHGKGAHKRFETYGLQTCYTLSDKIMEESRSNARLVTLTVLPKLHPDKAPDEATRAVCTYCMQRLTSRIQDATQMADMWGRGQWFGAAPVGSLLLEDRKPVVPDTLPIIEEGMPEVEPITRIRKPEHGLGLSTLRAMRRYVEWVSTQDTISKRVQKGEVPFVHDFYAGPADHIFRRADFENKQRVCFEALVKITSARHRERLAREATAIWDKQSEEWKKQSEEALTEANKLRTQIEVQQAQMAAQIEAQQAQMAAQIEAQQAQLARDDLARNLHKKLCEKPARKQRVLSGEGMRALFTEVVDTTAMTFRLDKSTLTSVALELIDNEAAFEGCRLAIHALFANAAQRGVRDDSLGVGVLLSHAGLFPGAEDGVPSSDAASASNAPALRRTK